jgi:hypothetical protein
MPELELTRSPDERRLYRLGGIGTLRASFGGRSATAEAGGRRWQIRRPSFWGRELRATAEGGFVSGEFEPNTFRRGGELRWEGRELTLRPSSSWRERYALADGELEVATLEGKGWGKRPVKITIEVPEAVDPGLLLFAAFVVRGFADDAGTAAAAAATTSSSAG